MNAAAMIVMPTSGRITILKRVLPYWRAILKAHARAWRVILFVNPFQFRRLESLRNLISPRYETLMRGGTEDTSLSNFLPAMDFGLRQSPAVIYAEDDCIPSPDILQLAEWYIANKPAACVYGLWHPPPVRKTPTGLELITTAEEGDHVERLVYGSQISWPSKAFVMLREQWATLRASIAHPRRPACPDTLLQEFMRDNGLRWITPWVPRVRDIGAGIGETRPCQAYVDYSTIRTYNQQTNLNYQLSEHILP